LFNRLTDGPAVCSLGRSTDAQFDRFVCRTDGPMDLRNDIYQAVRLMGLRIGFGRLTDGTYSTVAIKTIDNF